jgi:cytoskeleton protein RodZ
MSDDLDKSPSLALPDSEQEATSVALPKAGQMIKEARLSSGMHIGTLSMALKVPVKKLEALESEDWTILPDVVFVRALATSVCRQIKIDSTPILAALPQVASYRSIDSEDQKVVLNQPFRTSADAKFSWAKLPISMPMVASALALLLAAVVLIFLPSVNQQAATSKASVQDAAATAPIFPPPTATVDVPNLNTTTTSTLSAPILAPALTPTSSTSAPAVQAGAPILRITAKGVVWIEAKDSNGNVLVQRTLQPREVANVSGQPPLAVVIGRINEIDSILVRGKPLGTTGMSPDNVAHFEVK